MSKQIPLTKGYSATVDDEDYECLCQWRWSIRNSRGHLYAVRTPGSHGRQFVIWMHRLILDCPEHSEVDHINGDGLDNRRENLRIATRTQNLRNRRTFRNSRSGFKGVVFNPVNGRWKVTINFGTFDSAEDAAKAYDEAIKKLFGEFAKPNFDD